MQQDLLQSVIEVEREIQRHIGAEKKKAAAWLDDIQQSCRKEIEKTRAQLEENLSSTIDNACREAKEQASQRLAESDCKAKALQDIPREILEQIIVAKLKLLVPCLEKEAADDR